LSFLFFFMHPLTTGSSTLSLHDALPISFVVFVERALRKILVNYAKRQVGNKVYQGQSSHLPLKLNMAGVIPPIFASSIILFPATDRKSTRLNSSHVEISYAVFCLKKKKR